MLVEYLPLLQKALYWLWLFIPGDTGQALAENWLTAMILNALAFAQHSLLSHHRLTASSKSPSASRSSLTLAETAVAPSAFSHAHYPQNSFISHAVPAVAAVFAKNWLSSQLYYSFKQEPHLTSHTHSGVSVIWVWPPFPTSSCDWPFPWPQNTSILHIRKSHLTQSCHPEVISSTLFR